MDPTSIKLEDSWKSLLIQEFSEPYMVELREYLKGQILDRKTIYPKGPDYFAALNYTPYDKVSVVILGQDPYHGPGQAHGLSFSVPTDVRPPPSLINIYKELHDDLEIPPSTHGHLRHWAEQGVLLLNSVLTVEAMKPASHRGRGWEKFTDKIIEKVNEKEEPVAFVLWGAYAQKKGQYVDTSKHLVIKSPHPSPLSAHRGFLGSKPFSRINRFLQENGRKPVSWRLPSLPLH